MAEALLWCSWMNGVLESGERVALEVLAADGVSPRRELALVTG